MNQTEAINLLKEFSCLEPKSINSQLEKQQLSQAVKLISDLADCQNFGICADNLDSGINALKNYLKATGYQDEIKLDKDMVVENEPIYLKFNTEKMSSIVSNYQGEYRGVLISIFASYNPEIEGTYGYLPLNLFD